MHENELSRLIIGCAMKVHSEIGPGMLESVYEGALHYELQACGLFVQKQHPIPVIYRDVVLPDGFRADLIVERKVIVEIKALEVVPPVAYKVLKSYLRFADMRLGLLINFSEEHLRDGIKRVILGQLPRQ